jgi:hypothetical protein
MTQLVVIETDRLERIVSEAVARAVSEALAGATITPRPEWVSIHEAAEARGVTPKTIKRWIDKGEIEARGEGRARMVRV